MEPRLFGPSHRALYGIVHEPRYSGTAPSAVVVCYAGVHEYMRTHWAMRRLADQLADLGHTVLRFDYSGTGDSAGALSNAKVAHWLEDIQTAVEEIEDLVGSRRVTLVGHRLGALLAAQYLGGSAGQVGKVDRLVMWDPVCTGNDYFSELQARQDQRRAWSLLPKDPSPNTYLGYTLSAEMEQSLRDLSMPKSLARLRETIVLETQVAGEPTNAKLQNFLADTANEWPKQHILVDAGRANDEEGVLVPNQTLMMVRDAVGRPQ